MNTRLHELPVVVLVNKFTVVAPQASEAVGTVKSGVAVQSIVWSDPAWPITGAWLPMTVIDCVRVAEWLPQASVASHILVNTVTVQEVPVCVSLIRFTVAPLQSSAAVGAVKLGVVVQSTVALAPAWPIVGA